MGRRVVIVGGGVAGHLVALDLQHVADVTLVDPRDHLWVPMSGPRLLVEPDLADRALVPWDTFLPAVRHRAGEAVALEPDAVQVRHGSVRERVPFDWLVVATGAAAVDDWIVPDGAVRERRTAVLRARAARLAAAESVLVIGGGAVGVEVAGELATDTRAAVTLIHGTDELLPGTGLGPAAAAWLRRHGVTVLLGDQVHVDGDGPFEGTTDGGRPVRGEVVIRCTGLHPRTEWVTLPGALDPRGRVRTTSTLQVAGHPRIFAVGDVTDLPERKLARNAARHAQVVARNLRRLLDAPDASLEAYRPDTGDTLLVTLGRDAGVARLPLFGVVAWPWLMRWLKSAGVFVRKYRKRIGLTP